MNENIAPAPPKHWLSKLNGVELFLATQELQEKCRDKPVPTDLWRDYYTQEEYDALRAQHEEERLLLLKYGVQVDDEGHSLRSRPCEAERIQTDPLIRDADSLSLGLKRSDLAGFGA